MDDIYENIHDYNSSRERKTLIVFDDIIADIMTNKRFQAVIKELFIRCRKLITKQNYKILRLTILQTLTMAIL